MTDTQAQEAARLAEMIRAAMPDSYEPQAITDDDARTMVLAQEHLGTDNVATVGVAGVLAFADALLRSQAARIAELESRVHTCGPTCSKAGCINRRLTAERDALRAELARMREPLSDDAILHGFCKTPHTNQFVGAFKAGVRFAEAAHGITKTGGGV